MSAEAIQLALDGIGGRGAADKVWKDSSVGVGKLMNGVGDKAIADIAILAAYLIYFGDPSGILPNMEQMILKDALIAWRNANLSSPHSFTIYNTLNR